MQSPFRARILGRKEVPRSVITMHSKSIPSTTLICDSVKVGKLRMSVSMPARVRAALTMAIEVIPSAS
ncbi:MAG: hypothetical protein MJZ38_05885 [archaeon]|nr:hypothetical protein [archaeon]